jgi:hypothetical protein
MQTNKSYKDLCMRTIFYGIAYECPKSRRNKDCPLLEVAHLSFNEIFTKFDKLPDV